MVAEVSIEGAGKLNSLGASLKAAGEEGKGLKRELLRTIREETKPAIEDVRHSAEANLPKRGGLAARVAGSKFSTSTRFGPNTAGVRILGKSGYNIGRMNAGTLRHPVFGNRSVWVTQSVRPHWFDAPLERAADQGLRDAIIRAVDSISERVHPVSSFTVNGTTYQMVESKFTFAEAAAIEKVTGYTFGEVTSDEKLRGSARVIQAFIWVSIKRVHPTTTFSDLDEMAIDDIVFEEGAAEPDPTVPAEPTAPDVPAA